MKSQNNQILKHLQKGRKINPLMALDKFGCFRLASRINNLRADGHPIEVKMVEKNGKKFKEYWMVS